MSSEKPFVRVVHERGVRRETAEPMIAFTPSLEAAPPTPATPEHLQGTAPPSSSSSSASLCLSDENYWRFPSSVTSRSSSCSSGRSSEPPPSPDSDLR